MFNHARTLLLNSTGANNPGATYLGEELIPANYAALSLNTSLQSIRRHLFGADPDRAMLNYRSYQLLSMLEKTDLQEFVTDLDPRITYEFGPEHVFVLHDTWEPKVLRVEGTTDHIATISGASTRPDYTGKLYYQFQLTLNGTAAIMSRETPPIKYDTISYSLTNSLSPAFDLYYTGYKIYVNTISTAPRWSISGYLRPQISLSEIVQSLEKAGDPVLTALFGTKSIEPWSTFKNLWYDGSDVMYRLGAITLALIYRTDELRMNSNGA